LTSWRGTSVELRYAEVNLELANVELQLMLEVNENVAELDILPGDLADILSQVKRGSFDVHLEHRRLEATVNRLVVGIISAAAFVGSATLWSREVPPVVAGYSVPGVLGCAAAVFFLAWRVIRAIHKSGSLESR
jgi:hypothetical protein